MLEILKLRKLCIPELMLSNRRQQEVKRHDKKKNKQ